ncbi:MAG TPA: S8 family peptidase [Candidatus Egerieimonas intestinavium]|uniref:S8 family peptidase n=1 Tax=Candidatus Egerieimonas intestinavium TaxID=2840777 RepID=A0A9D1EK53_9FIRM|nr:S8 family peptidase [Candidatus Egerieimonas intestinavium]
MTSSSEMILSNDYADFITPTYALTEEEFTQRFRLSGGQIISRDYGMVHLLRTPRIDMLLNTVSYSSMPNLYTLLDTTSLEVSGIIQTQLQTTLNLTGRGVLLGFLDTGINYTHPAFKTSSGSTRILRIWDQTDQTGTPPEGLPYGSVYTDEDINRALQLEDPYSVVPSRDTDGHGTFLAGAAAGSADLSADFTGAAPEAGILMVKLKPAKEYLRDFYLISPQAAAYQETDLMMAIRYLLQTAQELEMPILLCIGLGSNQGDHSGYTPLEISLNRYESVYGVAVVCAAGNEAGRAHHFQGEIRASDEYQTVEVVVPEGSRGFTLELWGKSPELYSVGFQSPAGENIPRIPARLQLFEEIPFILDQTRISVRYELVQDTSGDQLIFLRFQAPSPGVWTIRVYCSNLTTGVFHLWLPITGFTDPDILFLAPNPYTTVTAPCTSHSVIALGAYSAANGSLYLHSSRGFARNGAVKPELCAPGVAVSGPNLREGYTQRSGTSPAAAIAAGGTALLMEWGLRQSPPRYYTNFELKNLLIRGAQRDDALTYPNREWGYGALNIYQVFLAISTT